MASQAHEGQSGASILPQTRLARPTDQQGLFLLTPSTARPVRRSNLALARCFIDWFRVSPCGFAALNTRTAACQKGIPMRALQSACCQAGRITFQLTSWLAAYTQTADEPRRSPFGSPCGCAALNTRSEGKYLCC